MQARGLFRHGDRVVVRSPRGVELGEVLSPATPRAIEQLEDPPLGQILREVSAQDQLESARLATERPRLVELCQRLADESGLELKVIDAEWLLGGERVVFYYLAEDRVDFRQLVKQLGGELRTRIEMRQVGVRDEAKLLADYGDCGKPVCCNNHLSQMPPVTMRMAKLQKATLDPTKISGRCGRLKCCLRFEYDHYEAVLAELPPYGASIVTPQGRARVLQIEILAQLLLVEMEDGRRITIPASDVLTVLPSRKQRETAEPAASNPADLAAEQAPGDADFDQPAAPSQES
jgi:cell fate regulator YaaT (PSP1 superfamily)